MIAIAGRRRRSRPPRRLVEAAGGRIDLVVNNASVLGPSPLPPLADYPLDALRRRLRGQRRSRRSRSCSSRCRASAPVRGIVNLSSDAAVEAYEGWGGYGSSKAALDAADGGARRRGARPARLRGRPGRHAHPDASGRVPRRGHLRPAAARDSVSRLAGADRGRPAERPLPRRELLAQGSRR